MSFARLPGDVLMLDLLFALLTLALFALAAAYVRARVNVLLLNLALDGR